MLLLLLLCHLLPKLIHQLVVLKEVLELTLHIGVACYLLCCWLRSWLSWLLTSCRCSCTSNWGLNIVECIMYFLSIFLVFGFVIILHPIEMPLLGRFKLQQVYSIFRLLYFFKLNVIRKHIKTINWIFSIGVTPLELFHATCILDYSNETLTPFRFDHASIIRQFSCFKFHKRFWTAHIRQLTKVS